ncbi:holo-ACP synthase [Limnobacter sp.]|uniref:holo-ACP synthase n=1 Tax=Limnobacter sp. TaxID=2003368 RepID=UPI003510FC12
MIIGLGCDIVEVQRIEGLLRKGHEGFVRRVLTPSEIEEYERRTDKAAQRGMLYLATRFAAKEAFSKAMGTGIGESFSFQDVAMLNSVSGRPVMEYSERIAQWLDSRGAAAEVSISDESTHAMATVIIFKKL